MSHETSSSDLEFSWDAERAALRCNGKLSCSIPKVESNRALSDIDWSRVDSKGQLAIDLSGVTDFDTSGIAMLVYLAHDLRARDVKPRTRCSASRLHAVLSLLEIDGELGVDDGPDEELPNLTADE